jgi:hypothetical protein
LSNIGALASVLLVMATGKSRFVAKTDSFNERLEINVILSMN